MPRTQREYALRFADQAMNDLDRALEKLAALTEMYPEGHQQYALYHAGFDAIGKLVTMAKENLTILRESYM